MPTTYHPDIDVIAATPWTIAGTLYDATGKLLDVTNCTLSWVLLDFDAQPVETSASITKTDPANGSITIEIPSTYTDLPPGRYTDTLQVIAGVSKDVFWTGQLRVVANPFSVS
jgi:hypothetical protein